MANYEDVFKKIISHAKEYGYVFQSSEIYDGLAAAYDYGPFGVELKNNIKNYWWKSMVNMHENIVGLDSAIFMHPTTWKASGHIDAFNDPRSYMVGKKFLELKINPNPKDIVSTKIDLKNFLREIK